MDCHPRCYEAAGDGSGQSVRRGVRAWASVFSPIATGDGCRSFPTSWTPPALNLELSRAEGELIRRGKGRALVDARAVAVKQLVEAGVDRDAGARIGGVRQLRPMG